MSYKYYLNNLIFVSKALLELLKNVNIRKQAFYVPTGETLWGACWRATLRRWGHSGNFVKSKRTFPRPIPNESTQSSPSATRSCPKRRRRGPWRTSPSTTTSRGVWRSRRWFPGRGCWPWPWLGRRQQHRRARPGGWRHRWEGNAKGRRGLGNGSKRRKIWIEKEMVRLRREWKRRRRPWSSLIVRLPLDLEVKKKSWNWENIINKIHCLY